MHDAGTVEILDPVSDEVVKHCLGPTREGSCPWVAEDGIVLCNGCLVAAPSAGPEYWRLWVPPESRHCPRAWNLEVVGY